MGISSSKTKTTQDQNTTQTGTTQPITPDWLTDAARGYVEKIGAYGEMDPNSFIAGPSPLQQQAWGNVDRLGGWQGQANTAGNLAFNAGTSGPNLAMKSGGMGRPQVAQAPQMVAEDIPGLTPSFGGGAPGFKQNPMAGGQVAQGPQFDETAGIMDKGPPRATEGGGFLPRNPGIVSGQGYAPAPSMPGYGQPRTGQPIGYTPPAGVDPNPALTGAGQMAAYSNPYDQQVIDTTLQGYDQDAGMRRAQLEANAARNGAFGGSRYGLAEGQFDASSALGRAGLEGGLRQQGFNTAAGYGMQDAAAGNNMLQFNAGQQDNALNRQLAAAGLLGQQASQYGADTRADLGVMAGLGDQQRGIEQAYAASPLAQLQMEGQLSGMTPYQILVGQQVNTNGTSHSTGTQTQSPSLFNQLLGLGQAASMFI